MWNIDVLTAEEAGGGCEGEVVAPHFMGGGSLLSPALKETYSWWTYGFLEASWLLWATALSQDCGHDMDFTHGCLWGQGRSWMLSRVRGHNLAPGLRGKAAFLLLRISSMKLNTWFTCAWWDLPRLPSSARGRSMQSHAHQRYLGTFCWYLQRDFSILTSFEDLNLLTWFPFTASSGHWFWSAQRSDPTCAIRPCNCGKFH